MLHGADAFVAFAVHCNQVADLIALVFGDALDPDPIGEPVLRFDQIGHFRIGRWCGFQHIAGEHQTEEYQQRERKDAKSGASAHGFSKYAHSVAPNTTDLVLLMERAGEITGSISAPGTIPSSFVIMLSRFDEHFKKKIKVDPRTFMAAKDGFFRMKDVAPGIYWLEVQADGYEGLDEPEVVVQAGQTTSNILIRLKEKPPR